MSQFVIPKGAPFSFTFQLRSPYSYLPQDLTNVNTAIFTLFERDNQNIVLTKNCIVVLPAEGEFKVDMTEAETNTLEIRRANKEDKYFLRVQYNANIEVTFTDGTLPASVFLEDVVVSPGGV